MSIKKSYVTLALISIIGLSLTTTATASWTDYINPFNYFASTSETVAIEEATEKAVVNQSAALPIGVTVTGTAVTVPALAGSYPDLSTALAAVNSIASYSTSGTVVLTLNGSETAPPTGFVIGSATLNPLLSATNTITLTATPGTAVINAGIGTATPGSAAPDGIISIRGADHITIDGLTLTDGNVTNPATMEFGIALFKAGAGDGANNNTIQNCTFNMQRINNATGGGPMIEGSVAINVVNSTATTATTVITPTNGGTLATNGTNSGNKVYTNTINGGNYGIGLSGFAASAGVGPAPVATTFLGDINNDIGGVASSTGNTILNFGGAASATNPSAGVRANNQWSVNVSFNTINNNNGGGVNHVTTIRGIFVNTAASASTTINNNTITFSSGATTSAATAIDNASGSTAASNTISLSNNTLNLAYTTATTGVMTGINNSATAATVNINGNTITGTAANSLGGTGTHVMIETGSPATVTTNSNNIHTLSRNGASGSWRGIKTTSPSNWTANLNTITNLSWTAAASTGGIDAIYSFSSAVNVTANNNTITNLSTPTTGTVRGIVEFGISGLKTFQGNTISNFSTTPGGAGGASFTGISESTGSTNDISGNTIFALNSIGSTGGSGGTIVGITVSGGTSNNIYKNKIYDLSSTSTNPAVSGITQSGGTTNNIYNNLIGDLRATAANAANPVNGLNITGGTTVNAYFNSVFLAGTSSGALFGSSAVSVSTTPTVELRNNAFVNTMTPTGAGVTVAHRRSGISLTGYASASNNNDFFGPTIFTDGTNTDLTIVNYRVRVALRDSGSFSENPPFLSTTGSSAFFLHVNTVTATQLESGGTTVSGITVDFDGDIRNVSTPDIGADEFAGTLLDLTAPSITYTNLANTASLANRTLSVTITDPSGVASGGNSPRIYFKKLTDVSYVTTQCGAPTGVVYPCSINNALVGGGSVMAGDIIQYFVVAQDNAGNVGANPSGGFAGTNVNTVTTPPSTPNQYTIVAGISGSFNVGAAETYTSLTNTGGIFEFINNSEVIGNVTISITSDLSATSGTLVAESGTVALNQYAGFSVTIQPSAGVLRTIEGSAATGLIRFNGADNVVVDGRFAGTGRFLRFRNTSTSNGSFVLLNDATNNTIRSSVIESSTTSNGSVFFSTSTGTLGNSGNTVADNEIRDRSDAAGVPTIAVASTGTTGALNANNTISANNIFNHTTAGVSVSSTGNGLNWQILNNSIYQTAARTTALTGIVILSGANGNTVSGNLVGGTAPNAGGANLSTSSNFVGINLSVGTGTATSVQGNVVRNIRSTALGFTANNAFRLSAGSFNVGTVTGNTVGSATVAERYEVNGDSTGFLVASTGTVNFSNNQVLNMGTNTAPATGQFYFGMQFSGVGVFNVTNNTVSGLVNASTTDATFDTQTAGIVFSPSGANSVLSRNTVTNIGSTSTAVVTALNNRIWGIIFSGTVATASATRNQVSNIYGSSPTTGARADIITVFQTQSAAAGTVANNFLLTDGGASSERPIFGIIDLSTGALNFHHNSVNIYGAASGGANSTYAFNRNGTSTANVRNNIFNNVRTGGTGFHVAEANTNASIAGFTSNFNAVNNVDPAHLFQNLGSLAANNRTLAAWQTETLQDANSIGANPQFISTTDLHLNAATTPLLSAGIAGLATVDYDGDPRPAMTPDIGADEIVQAEAGVIPTGTFYNASFGDLNTLAGNVSVTNTLYLAGVTSGGAFTTSLGCNASVVGASSFNYINGAVMKDFCAIQTFSFPVGQNGYTPAEMNVTALATNPSSLLVSVIDTDMAGLDPTRAVSRYWSVTETGDVTATMNFNYLQADVTGDETTFKVFRKVGTGFPAEHLGSTVNAVTNVATAPGVSNFSFWGIGAFAPTAAGASVSGRVTTADGRGIVNAVMVVTGNSLQTPIRVRTGSFGYYTFENLEAGETYIITVNSKRFSFTMPSRIVTVNDTVVDFDFVAMPQE